MPGASQGCGAAVGEEGSFGGSLPRSASDCGNSRALQEWGRDSWRDSGSAEGVHLHQLPGNTAILMLSFAP